MKKILSFLSILLLAGGLMFGATETSIVTLTATIAETSANSGIRVSVGDISSTITDKDSFENAFKASTNTITIDVQEEISQTGAEGYFTVLVKRAGVLPVQVTVSADPMKKVDGSPYYLGFKITKGGETNNMINTVSSPSSTSSGITYDADNTVKGMIRDVAVFEYEVPQNTTVPLGKYETNIYYSITTQ